MITTAFRATAGSTPVLVEIRATSSSIEKASLKSVLLRANLAHVPEEWVPVFESLMR